MLLGFNNDYILGYYTLPFGVSLKCTANGMFLVIIVCHVGQKYSEMPLKVAIQHSTNITCYRHKWQSIILLPYFRH